MRRRGPAFRASLLTLVASALTAAAAPDARAAAPQPGGVIAGKTRRILLAVGVDRFRDEAPAGERTNEHGWLGLRFAEKDARDVAAALARYGFEPWEGKVLTGSAATRRAVHDALEGLIELTDNDADDYELVLYFASHGFELRGQSFVTLHDTPSLEHLRGHAGTEAAVTGALGREELLERFVPSLGARVRSVALIYDVCDNASGRVAPVFRGEAPAPTFEQLEARHRQGRRASRARHAVLVLAAAAPEQPAAEVESLENGLYTHYLKAALVERADEVRTETFAHQPLSLFGAHHWAAARVAGHTGGAQTPVWSGPSYNRNTDLFFFLEDQASGRAASAAAFLLRGDAFLTGYRMVARLAGEVAARGDGPTARAWEGEVPAHGLELPTPGTYEVELYGPDGALEASRAVVVRPGVQTIYALDELRRRSSARVAVSGGIAVPAELWGPSAGLPLAAYVRAAVEREDWPTDGLAAAAFAELSFGSRTHPLESATVYHDVAFLLAAGPSWPMDVGFGRLAVSPFLGAGGLWRHRDESISSPSSLYAFTSAGLRARIDLPLTDSLELGLEATARVDASGLFDNGTAVGGLALALARRTATAHVREAP